MRVLVTGSRGFLGREVVKELRKHYDVTEFSRSLGLDVRDRETVFDYVSNSDVVVHLASILNEHSKELYSVNVLGTRNVADACEELGVRLIFSSSVGVYGDTGGSPKEESDPPHPQTPYEVSKALAEHVILSRQLDYVILRFAPITGDHPSWKKLREYASIGVPLPYRGQKWQLVSLSDAVGALAHSLRENLSGIYNVAHPSLYDFKEVIRSLTGGKGIFASPSLLGPFYRLLGKYHYFLRLVRYRLYMVGKLLRSGWEPRVDPLKELGTVSKGRP